MIGPIRMGDWFVPIINLVVGLSGNSIHRRGMFGVKLSDDLKALVRRTGRPVTTIFDVGANHGQMARYFRQHFPHATLHCFDPNPGVHRELEALAARDRRMYVVRKALSDRSGQADFFCYENDLLSSL